MTSRLIIIFYDFNYWTSLVCKMEEIREANVKIWRLYAITSVIGPDVRHFQLLHVFCVILCRTIEIVVSVAIF